MKDSVPAITDIARQLAEAEWALRNARENLAALEIGDPAVFAPSLEILAEKARRLLLVRHKRTRQFGGHLFGEPAWDMLLELFAAEIEGQQVSVTSLCVASHGATTTALRWIQALRNERLIDQVDDVQDRRRKWVTLTRRAFDGMRMSLLSL